MLPIPKEKVNTSQPTVRGIPLLGLGRNLGGARKAQQLKVRQLSSMEKASLPFTTGREDHGATPDPASTSNTTNHKINRGLALVGIILFTNRRYVILVMCS